MSEVCKTSAVRGCNIAVLFNSAGDAIAAPGIALSKFADRELVESVTLCPQVIGTNEDMKV
ncbi:MAG: hypothetical protein OES20_12045 [Gammaproteobacteria bacterium]|nr:hypothetical protein [Gammaproteobacteria bacterium]